MVDEGERVFPAPLVLTGPTLPRSTRPPPEALGQVTLHSADGGSS